MCTCPHIEMCSLFHRTLADLPALATIYRNLYCRDRPDVCARYLIMEKLGRDKVPSSLYPNQIDRADRLIRAG